MRNKRLFKKNHTVTDKVLDLNNDKMVYFTLATEGSTSIYVFLKEEPGYEVVLLELHDIIRRHVK